MILTVIIISALISVVMIRVAAGSLASLNNFSVDLKSAKIKNLTETCLNEALLSLSRDEAYPGGSLTFTNGTCTVSISGTDNNREISISALDSDGRAKALTAAVTLSPFAITSWE